MSLGFIKNKNMKKSDKIKAIIERYNDLDLISHEIMKLFKPDCEYKVIMESDDIDVKITEIIEELSKGLESGYKNIRIETFEDGCGTTEDGSPEYEYTSAKLILY